MNYEVTLIKDNREDIYFVKAINKIEAIKVAILKAGYESEEMTSIHCKEISELINDRFS